MKIVLLVLLIAILGAGAAAGLYLYLNRKPLSIVPILPEPNSMLIINATATPKPTSAPKIENTPKLAEKSEADNLLQNYYDFYLSCLQGHFANLQNAKGPTNSPQDDCPYNQTGALSDQLALKIKPIVGYDPILCSQDLPDKITYDKSKITGGTAKAVVHEEFAAPTTSYKTKSVTASASAGETINIPVQLDYQNAQWQITVISCPK